MNSPGQGDELKIFQYHLVGNPVGLRLARAERGVKTSLPMDDKDWTLRALPHRGKAVAERGWSGRVADRKRTPLLAAALVGSSCAHDNSPDSPADPRNRRRRRSTVHPSSNVRVSGGVSRPCASGGSWGHWFVCHFNRLQQLRFSSARARRHPQLRPNDVFGFWTYPASLQNARAMPGNLPGERQNTDFNLQKLLQTAFCPLLTDYKPPTSVYCIPAVCSRAGCGGALFGKATGLQRSMCRVWCGADVK